MREPTQPGHLFVVRGRIGEIVADAVVVTTDRPFTVELHWNAALELSADVSRGEHRAYRPDDWGSVGWGPSRRPTTIPVWFLDVWDPHGDPAPVLDRLTALLDAAAASLTAGATSGRQRALILIPVIGTNLGGFSHRRGEIISVLVDRCAEFTIRSGVDLAIVAHSAAAFGALQHHRRSQPDRFFGDCSALEEAKRLAGEAQAGALALFLGAGASRIRVAVSHALLAGLDCQNAVTTNYDDLYERAVRAIDRRVAVVLPDQVPTGNDRWLLKMHGSLQNEKSIVLTRSQFVGFDAASAPSGAVLQALLLTKHLLIVGTSMTDDNVLRLIHEVAAFRALHEKDRRQHKFGTILAVEENQARKLLHGQRFHWLPMPGANVSEGARQLEIFLDALGAFASSDASWLLDDRFSYLLGEQQRGWVDSLRTVASTIEAAPSKPEAWQALLARLAEFGAGEADGAGRSRAPR